MRTTRRDFIRILGGGVIGAATVSTAACDRVPAAANAPWREAGQGDDPRRRMLSWALLAPNPHNTQAWLVDLATPQQIVLFCDRDRLLPETDPFQRQILIGHGCFIELLALAAAAEGYRAEVELFPDGAFPAGGVDDRPVARVRLTAGAGKSDPLFRQISARRTNREAFDRERAVDDAALAALQAAAARPGVTLRASNVPTMLTALRDLTWRAHELEMTTPRVLMESVELMRIGEAEMLQHRDGIALGGTLFEVGRAVGMITHDTMADPQSIASRQGLAMFHDLAMSAMAFGWIVSDGNDRAAQVEAGRAYVRTNLKATELGLAMHPWSQALQEYPEMARLQRELLAALQPADGEQVQMLFRLGYADAVPPSPRRPLQALIRA